MLKRARDFALVTGATLGTPIKSDEFLEDFSVAGAGSDITVAMGGGDGSDSVSSRSCDGGSTAASSVSAAATVAPGSSTVRSRLHRARGSSPTVPVLADGRFGCSACAVVFTTPRNARVHYDTIHLGVRAFKCHRCPSAFAQPHQLKEHVWVHGRSLAFACTEGGGCDASYGSRHLLRKHLQHAHSGGRAASAADIARVQQRVGPSRTSNLGETAPLPVFAGGYTEAAVAAMAQFLESVPSRVAHLEPPPLPPRLAVQATQHGGLARSGAPASAAACANDAAAGVSGVGFSVIEKGKVSLCAFCEASIPSRTNLQRHREGLLLNARQSSCVGCGATFIEARNRMTQVAMPHAIGSSDSSSLLVKRPLHRAPPPLALPPPAQSFAMSTPHGFDLGRFLSRVDTGGGGVCADAAAINNGCLSSNDDDDKSLWASCATCARRILRSHLSRHIHICRMNALQRGGTVSSISTDEGSPSPAQPPAPRPRFASVGAAAGERGMSDSGAAIALAQLANAAAAMSATASKDAAAVAAATLPRPHTCPHCEACFSDTGSRSSHVFSAHLRLKPFVCSLCPASFASAACRSRHAVAAHGGLAPYICGACGEARETALALLQHAMAEHPPVAPRAWEPCPWCDAAFHNNTALAAHAAAEHDDRPVAIS